MAADDFASLLEAFFLQWMGRGRQLSAQTISSYRDTFSLFLRWMRDSEGVPPERVTMDDVTAANVERFLLHLSEARGNSAATVNCRLAAIKAFCGYAAWRAPDRLAQMRLVGDIPRRREKRREVCYLTYEEYGWILDACRDGETRLMVELLFSTGVRVSELVGLRAGDFSLGDRVSTVTVLGKGRKTRTLPLWDEVADDVGRHIESRALATGDRVFPGRNVEHLTRSGARSRIDAAVRAASAGHPELAGKKVTPHVFRHSTAMGMLEAGVDISTIAIWLGHESIQTTHRYMVTDMRRKEEALGKVHRPSGGAPSGRYKPSQDVLSFLQSL